VVSSPDAKDFFHFVPMAWTSAGEDGKLWRGRLAAREARGHMRHLASSLWATLILLIGVSAPAPAAEDPAAETIRYCYTLRSAPPEPVCIREAAFYADVCGAIETFAGQWRLPPGYFARLVWQESRFDPLALSTAGAQGIAQFMPSTARLRGLKNAFDPAEALARSAEYLRFLTDKFGNLGLAAAAYNGGEGRMARFLSAGGSLPAETRHYVEIITGRAVEHWFSEPVKAIDFRLDASLPFAEACVRMANTQSVPRLDRPAGEWQPWGVLLAEHFSQSVAIRKFERTQQRHAGVIGGEKLLLLQARNPSFGRRLRHRAMLGRDTREEAEELCTRLRSEGAACVVKKN
jgi:hypothetical protein